MIATSSSPHANSAGVTNRRAANRLGLWLFLASETFLFAAFISSRFVVSGTDQPEHLNQGLALLLTLLLLWSSISAYRAEVAISTDNRNLFLRESMTTIVLGVLFLVGVVFEFKEALADFPAGTIYGSVFFLLIGLHAFHVLTGILVLAIVWNLGRAGHYDSENHWPVEGAVKYWHFVDLMWVAIYPTLYLFGGS